MELYSIELREPNMQILRIFFMASLPLRPQEEHFAHCFAQSGLSSCASLEAIDLDVTEEP